MSEIKPIAGIVAHYQGNEYAVAFEDKPEMDGRLYSQSQITALLARIALLEKACEASAEWFGPSLQDARFETVAVIKALREASYRGTTQESGQ